MIKDEKSHLDSIWIDTEVYTWLKFLSCGKYIFWQGNFIAEKLAKELKTWDKYVEYMETFDEKVNAAMYETDIFDSYMANHLHT